MSDPVETALFDLLAQAGEGRSVAPEAVARAANADDWRRVLPRVRATAVGLARQGRVIITRHNRPVDPDQPFKGVYRLRLPTGGGGDAGG